MEWPIKRLANQPAARVCVANEKRDQLTIHAFPKGMILFTRSSMSIESKAFGHTFEGLVGKASVPGISQARGCGHCPEKPMA